ncbi:MAG: aromatic ring-hydroxylating dioxygenase subunit alpha [Sphingomonadales bacterium]|nr:aromatic ring-hydroxylating dioxygenase subunit alpha [Sphingomonadales bacterium]
MAEADSASARGPGRSWNQLAAADTNGVPGYLLEDHERDMGDAPIGVERYVSPEFFALEMERMWPRVWQFAAREEELPEPGDSVVYEYGHKSFLLVRQPDRSIRAFYNACLHRGRKLRLTGGKTNDLRCPYHAFTWHGDGSLKSIPCRWDFKHLEGKDMDLPQVQVGTWGGYVFIKEEPGGMSLEDYLAPLPEHFRDWGPDECYTVKWGAKVLKANWKVCMEAFIEAFHVIATHPQILPFTADTNSKYALFTDHTNLTITPFGVTSAHVPPADRDEQWVIDQFLKYNGRVVEPGMTVEVNPGETARRAMGAHNRARFGAMIGRDLSQVSDAEVQDAFTYNVFPNFSPWGGYGPAVVYRWRPWPDQDHTLMEVRLIQRARPGETPPPCPEMVLIPEGEDWEPLFGQLGAVLNQDMANIPHVHTGMRALRDGQVELAHYQESRVRHWHQTIDKYLAGDI